jgi:hypothetical protein
MVRDPTSPSAMLTRRRVAIGAAGVCAAAFGAAPIVSLVLDAPRVSMTLAGVVLAAVIFTTGTTAIAARATARPLRSVTWSAVVLLLGPAAALVGVAQPYVELVVHHNPNAIFDLRSLGWRIVDTGLYYGVVAGALVAIATAACATIGGAKTKRVDDAERWTIGLALVVIATSWAGAVMADVILDVFHASRRGAFIVACVIAVLATIEAERRLLARRRFLHRVARGREPRFAIVPIDDVSRPAVPAIGAPPDACDAMLVVVDAQPYRSTRAALALVRRP